MNSCVKNESCKKVERFVLQTNNFSDVFFFFLLFQLIKKIIIILDIILASVCVFQQVFTIFTELVLIYC